MTRTIVALAALALSVVSVPQLAPAQAPPQFVLNGIVIPDNGRAFVWIQEPTLTQGKVIVLRPGETVGPYRLGKVEDDRVELEGPGGKMMVPLYARAPGAPAAPGATAGRTPAPVVVSTPGPQPGRMAGAPPAAGPGIPPRAAATPPASTAPDETTAEDRERAGTAAASVSGRPMPYHPPSNHPATPPVPLAQRTDLTPQDVKALSTPGITIPFGDPRTKFPSSFRGK